MNFKIFLYLAIILGVAITGIRIFFIVRDWNSGDAINIASYTTPLPSNMRMDVLGVIDEREDNLSVDSL